MQYLLLALSLIFLVNTSPAQNLAIPANWQVGEKWHYELLWTIDAPELRGKNPPTSILAYPIFEVLEADREGYTLSVHCDSAAVLTGPTGRQAQKGAVVHYQLRYIFRTTPAGRFAGIQNQDSLSAQLLACLQKIYIKSDASGAHRRTTAIPNWQEAYFLRDYGFIFDGYGRSLQAGRETAISISPDQKFYHLYNDVPLEITFFDSIIGAPTVMKQTMTLSKEDQAFRAEAKGQYNQPAYEQVSPPFTFRYEEKRGYYRSSASYELKTGRFLEGELVFGTSGGVGQAIFENGDPRDLGAQLIEERRVFKSFTPQTEVAAADPVAPEGIILPVFPKYEEVVRHFFQEYKGSNVPEFTLSKHPDGYRITRLDDQKRQLFEPEWIWTVKGGWQPFVNFNKPEPADPDAPEGLVEGYNPYEWEKYAERHLRSNAYQQRECDRQPYFGYPGFYNDVIALLEPPYEALSNDQLHTLARCYSFAAGGLLHNHSGFADSTRIFRLEPGQNALSAEQLIRYKAAHEKAVEAYALLLKRDPVFSTPVGSVRTKYANEVMDGFLTLLYFQNEKEAGALLQRNLYDDFLLQAARNTLKSCPEDAVLVTYGDSDTYPLLYLQATEKVRTDVTVANVSLLNVPRYYLCLTKGVLGAKPLKTLLPDQVFSENFLMKKEKVEAAEQQSAVAFLQGLGRLRKADKNQVLTLPFDQLLLPPAPAGASFPGTVPVQAYWKPGSSYLTLNALALLDVVVANNWSRPLCFAPTCGSGAYADWQGALGLEGLVYRVFPGFLPRLNWKNYNNSQDKSLDLWRRAFRFEVKEAALTQEMIPFFYSQFLSGLDLAKSLQKAERCADALEVATILDRSFTDAMRPRNYLWADLVEIFAACGQTDQAEGLGLQIWDNYLRKKVDENDLKDRENLRWGLKHMADQYGLEKLKNLR
ncbi:MAG: hypothetical protein IPJ40_03970 [Saprospirales bacterium]|nr:hypothetical protein [Saprospirales bacterium]